MAEKKKYLYVEAANGLTVRIPAGKYTQWKKAQEKGGEADLQTVKQIRAYMDRKSQRRPWG